MNKDEWPDLKRIIEAGWMRSSLDDNMCISLLRPYPADVLGQALRGLLGKSKFAPTPSEIVGAARQLMGAQRTNRPAMPVSAEGEKVLARVGIAPPWLIDGRRFMPDVSTLVLHNRTTRHTPVDVVSCAGWWDGDGEWVSWESWDVGLIKAARELQAEEAA